MQSRTNNSTLNKIKQRNLDLAILLCAGIANPLWGLFTPAILLPGAIDGIGTRMLGASFSYLGLAFGCVDKKKRSLNIFVTLNSFLLIAHYIWLCNANQFDSVYTNGIYIPISALAVFLTTRKQILTFAVLVPALSCSIFLHSNPLSNPFFFMMGVVTVNTIVCLTNFLRVNAEQQLRKTEKMRLKIAHQAELDATYISRQEKLNRLVAGIAHEFNNPLAIVTGMLNQLERWPDKRESIILKRLTPSIKASKRITSILKDLHSIVLGPYSDALEESPVSDLLNQSKIQMVPLASKLNVELSIDVPDNSNKLTVNPILTPRAIEAILENAIKAAAESEEKTVHVHYSQSENKIFVTNSGEQISSDNFTKIFDPFFTTRTVGEGVGLGLSVARSSMEKINGSVTLQNYTDLEPHTTFCLSFSKTESKFDREPNSQLSQSMQNKASNQEAA